MTNQNAKHKQNNNQIHERRTMDKTSKIYNNIIP